MNDIFNIGDLVNWKIGNIFSIGIVYEDTGGEFVVINLLESMNRKSSSKIKVERKILNKHVK